MKRLLTILVTFMAVLSSCTENIIDDTARPETDGFDQPVTESTDEYTITYQYNEGVIVLDAVAQSYLVKVEADTILYFSAGTPGDILPGKGDVISARVSEKVPYGLGNVVLETSESDGMIKCVTTVAGLDEIFKEVSWEYNSSLTDALLEGYEDENGVAVKPSYGWYDEETGEIITEDTKATVGRKKLVSWPFEKNNPDGLSIEGELFVGAFVHCSGDTRKGDFEFSVEPVIGAEALIGIKAEVKKEIWQNMFQWKLFELKDKLKTMIQLGPVTLRPYVDIEAYLRAAASGSVLFDTGKVFSAKIGYSQAGGCYISNSTASGNENNFIKGVSINGNVGAEYECIFSVGCGLYTKNVALELDPYFKYQTGAELVYSAGEDSEKTESNLFLGITVGADGKMVINWFGGLKFAPEMKFLETELARWDYPLIPVTKEDSFSIEKRNDSNAFDAQYVTEGGFLSWLYDIYPAIAIYKGEELVYEKTFSEKADPLEPLEVAFLLDKLEDNTTYKAKAFVKVWDHDFVMETMTFPDDRWVDLGLPSGILWAAYNVGADSPEEYGGYYAWGETEEKSSYTWENYKYGKTIPYMEELMYRVDLDKVSSTISGTHNDVAHVIWGDGARMPCPEDLEELSNFCTYKSHIINNISGCLITGPNKNTIFLPLGGYYSNNGFHLFEDGYPVGIFWMGKITFESDVLYYTPAVVIGFDEGQIEFGADLLRPSTGLTVRPVKDKPKEDQ